MSMINRRVRPGNALWVFFVLVIVECGCAPYHLARDPYENLTIGFGRLLRARQHSESEAITHLRRALETGIGTDKNVKACIVGVGDRGRNGPEEDSIIEVFAILDISEHEDCTSIIERANDGICDTLKTNGYLVKHQKQQGCFVSMCLIYVWATKQIQ